MPSPTVTIKHRGEFLAFAGMSENDHMIANMKVGKYYDLPFLEIVRSLDLRGTFLDLGANIGTHSVYFSRYCIGAHVHAVEAHPDIFRVLCSNMRRNVPDGIPYTLDNAAVVGDLSQRYTAQSISDYNSGMTKVKADNSEDGQFVTPVLLSQLLSVHVPVFVKMDLQGHEAAAIKEAAAVLSVVRPILVIKFLFDKQGQGDSDFKETNTLLRGLGYRTFGPWSSSPRHMWVHESDQKMVDKLKPFEYLSLER